MPMNRFLRSALASTATLLLCAASANGQADACAADVNGDGIVAAADLAVVLGNWGPCVGCRSDINSDQLVDAVDLALVLTRWNGTCAPTISAISPTVGPTAGAMTVAIAGNHLLNPLTLTFGGTPAVILSSTATMIIASTPQRTAGLVDVAVQTKGATTVALGAYQYFGTPTISTVTPNAGYTAGGALISITGSGFYPPMSVTVGSGTATSVAIVSPTLVQAITPIGALGAVTISISTPSGSATLRNSYAYVAVTVPAWATLVEAAPDPSVVTDPLLRAAIAGTGLAWRVRDASTNIEMLLAPPGSFTMGCSGSLLSRCGNPENPAHVVTLTTPYYIGRYEITQAQWQARMGSNPSYFQGSSYPNASSRPVEQVSWYQIQPFLLSTGFRLPTEAEWERACRAGTQTAFNNGTDDDALAAQVAWFGNHAASQTHSVGTKAANALGLHDMLGNVWEWCQDWYGSYSEAPATNPIGPALGGERVLRGGAWDLNSYGVRTSYRGSYSISMTYSGIGFRVARNP